MSRKIIVIDDEEAILDAYLSILSPTERNMNTAALETVLFGESRNQKEFTRDSYEVTTALQGEEGFEKVKIAREKGEPFTLAFIDVQMPTGWDGLMTAKMIRQADSDIEIVIATAYSDRSRSEMLEMVGRPEKLLYLKKPFDPEEIRQLALCLTKKWESELKARKHREQLERLLSSVRHLKTLSVSSVKDALPAVLEEVLQFADARRGFIAKMDGGRVSVEIQSDCISPSESDLLMEKLSDGLSGISQIGNILIVPLKDRFKTLFVLVPDFQMPVSGEKLDLLRILAETCSDVLESVSKQEQFLKNEKIATIGQVASGFIHEINSPLMDIIRVADMYNLEGEEMWKLFGACSGLLKVNGLPPGIREEMDDLNKRFDPEKMRKKMARYHSIMLNGASRIRKLMENIRNFSKWSDRFEPRHHDVSDALEDTLVLAHNILKYGITVHKEWERPLLAKCDINGLKQVFLNLILNAVQAMKGVGHLWITGKRADGTLLISIRDSGPGIPQETKNRIFDAFYTTKTDGTGLGLSIVKGVIDKHGGSIRAECELGEGTGFHIEIPDVMRDAVMSDA